MENVGKLYSAHLRAGNRCALKTNRTARETVAASRAGGAQEEIKAILLLELRSSSSTSRLSAEPVHL